MKKTLIIFLLLILGVVGFSVFRPEGLSTLIVENNKISKEAKGYAIEASVPYITSGIPKKSKELINEFLKNEISKIVESEDIQFQEISKELESLPQYASLSSVSEFSEAHDFSHSPFINFKFEHYSYTGGAHGGTTIATYIFNAKTGIRLSWNDVFKENTLKELGEKIFIEMKEKDQNFSSYIFIEEGLSPNIENFKNFEILSGGIRFTFGDYQIGPYALGRPEVVLPYIKVKDILKEEFLLTLKIK
jgi:hypothetical protein